MVRPPTELEQGVSNTVEASSDMDASAQRDNASSSYDSDQNNAPYISQLFTISEIAQIDFQNCDSVYAMKLAAIGKKYASVRKTRGDGNCFYRSFIFLLFEKFLADSKTREKFTEIFESSKEDLIQVLKLEKFTVSDFSCEVDTLLEQIANGSIETSPQLIEALDAQGVSDSVLYYFRLMTAYETLKNHELYEPFIAFESATKTYHDLVEYCQNEIQRMYVDTDYPHYYALANFLKVRLSVVVCDRSMMSNNDEVQVNIAGDENSSTTIAVLFRPGHYDCIYELGV